MLEIKTQLCGTMLGMMSDFRLRIPGFLIFCIISGLASEFSAMADPAQGGSTQALPPGTVVAPYASGARPMKDSTDYEKDQTQGEALLDSNVAKCGQDCHYQKANENISMQAHYINKKIEYLNSSATDENKRKILGGFCGDAEDLDKCIDRYEDLNEFWRAKVRGSLAKNNKAIVDLKCTKYDDAGKCMVTESATVAIKMQPDEPEKNPQAPYMTKSSDLAMQADLLRQQRASKGRASPEIRSNQDWVQSILAETNGKGTDGFDSLKPQKEDFVKFKSILRDPSNPRGGTFEVPNGYDVAAYQAALQSWESLKNQADPKNLLAPTLKGKANIGDTIRQNRQEFKQDFKGPAQGVRSPAREVYDNARGEYVQVVNDMMWGGAGKTGSVTFNPQNNPQTPQNPVDPKTGRQQVTVRPPPPGGYTGNEEVRLINPNSGDRTKESRYSVTYDPSQLGTQWDTNRQPTSSQTGQGYQNNSQTGGPTTGAPSTNDPSAQIGNFLDQVR